MLILWIRKKKPTEQPGPRINDNESFQKHDENMKNFRFSHPELDTVDSKDIITADGNILASVHNVKLTKYAQN